MLHVIIHLHYYDYIPKLSYFDLMFAMHFNSALLIKDVFSQSD